MQIIVNALPLEALPIHRHSIMPIRLLLHHHTLTPRTVMNHLMRKHITINTKVISTHRTRIPPTLTDSLLLAVPPRIGRLDLGKGAHASETCCRRPGFGPGHLDPVP